MLAFREHWFCIATNAIDRSEWSTTKHATRKTTVSITIYGIISSFDIDSMMVMAIRVLRFGFAASIRSQCRSISRSRVRPVLCASVGIPHRCVRVIVFVRTIYDKRVHARRPHKCATNVTLTIAVAAMADDEYLYRAACWHLGRILFHEKDVCYVRFHSIGLRLPEASRWYNSER